MVTNVYQRISKCRCSVDCFRNCCGDIFTTSVRCTVQFFSCDSLPFGFDGNLRAKFTFRFFASTRSELNSFQNVQFFNLIALGSDGVFADKFTAKNVVERALTNPRLLFVLIIINLTVNMRACFLESHFSRLLFDRRLARFQRLK